MRRFFELVGLEVRGMHHAAYILAGFALGSQLLALVRDRLLASSFGAGETLDLYYSAFRIPDLLFVGLASLLSLYALLPVLSKLEVEHPGLVISFMRKMLLLFFVGMGAVGAVVFVLAPFLVTLVVPGLADDPETASALVFLTRILLLQPILLGVSNLLANLTQLRHRFVLYSISPLLYNLGIIAGILFFYPAYGVAGLAWGVVLGAALHALVQLPFFTLEREKQTLPWRKTFIHVKEVLVLSVPRTLALSAGQISILFVVALASFLPAGSISVFTFAWNLQAVPLTIIGVSYSVAAFPTLARFFASEKREEFVRHVEAAVRHIIFWSLPAVVLVVILRAHIVRTVLGAGAFDWSATRLTAAALALFVLSLLAQSISLLVARAYYAAGNTVRPLLLALIEVVVSVASAFLLVLTFNEYPFFRSLIETLLRVEDVPGTVVLMLALGLSVGALVKFALGLAFLTKDFELTFTGLGRLAFESASAAILGGAAAYGTLQLFDPLLDTTTLAGILTQGTVAGLAGLSAAGVILWLLGSRELAEIVNAAHRRLMGAEVVAIEPSDMAQAPK